MTWSLISDSQESPTELPGITCQATCCFWRWWDLPRASSRWASSKHVDWKPTDGILAESLSLWNQKVHFWKQTPKLRNPFAVRELLSFIEISQLLCATKLKNSGSQIGTYTTLGFTVKGITNQLDLTWIWCWSLLSYKRLLCTFCQVWLGEKKLNTI